ncbi:hypothetical protein [Kribbella pratensis]|uniref:hypothetical protein n=1 Tax=Kribbella pratensis TaxID=2512112 RepID=UPI00192D26CF|nr:hypothetical protein [Kribbella pratensis]
MTDVAMTAITRRGLLAAAGTGTIIALAPMSFAAAATGTKTQVVDGQIARADRLRLPSGQRPARRSADLGQLQLLQAGGSGRYAGQLV